MANLDSPYVVGYFDTFINVQRINLIIEYCPYGDLNTLVEKQKMLNKQFVDNQLWKIFIHLCLGLQYLHSKNIIHRDLKTLNIFMLKDNIAKIGDLGCAKIVEPTPPKKEKEKPKEEMKVIEEKIEDPKDTPVDIIKQSSIDNPFDIINDEDDFLLTAGVENLLDEQNQGDCVHSDILDDLLAENNQTDSTAMTPKQSDDYFNPPSVPTSQVEQEVPQANLEESDKVGTPYYMAPEIWKYQKYGKESDIWALGVILYEICCLQYPFPANELDELEKKVLNDKIQRVPNGVNKDFVELFMKMLKKDPSKRPTIEEIIYSDVFQNNTSKHLITLPLILNK